MGTLVDNGGCYFDGEINSSCRRLEWWHPWSDVHENWTCCVARVQGDYHACSYYRRCSHWQTGSRATRQTGYIVRFRGASLSFHYIQFRGEGVRIVSNKWKRSRCDNICKRRLWHLQGTPLTSERDASDICKRRLWHLQVTPLTSASDASDICNRLLWHLQATPLTSASDASDMPLALTIQARKWTEKLSPSALSFHYFQFRGEGEKGRELSVSNRAVQEIFINTMSVARSQISTSQARVTSQVH
jgi:hypothetical protein